MTAAPRNRPESRAAGPRSGRKRPASAKRLRELAAASGYSVDSVRKWIARGWDGDVATVEAWRAENLGRPGRRPLLPRADRRDLGGVAATAEGDWGDKFRKVRTMREALELRARQGELVERAEVERMLLQRIAEVRAALLSLGRSMRLRLEHQPGEVVERLLDARVREVLLSFARPPEVLAEPTTPSGGAERKRRRTRAGRS